MMLNPIRRRLETLIGSFARLLAIPAIICCCTFSAHAQSSDLALDFTGTSLNGFNANLTLGWSFRVNEPIRITELGFFDHFDSDEDGLAHDHVVRIWTDEINPQQLAETTITNASTPANSMAENGRWLFNTIAPVVLVPGDYIIGADDPACAGANCDRFRFIVAESTIPEITFLEARSASPPGPPQSPQPNLHAGYFGPTFKTFPLGIILGDVNGDGAVDLLDVAPFVDAIANGTYIPEADINQDGSVDLLDISLFVGLLNG